MRARVEEIPVFVIPVGTVQQSLSTDVSLRDQNDCEKQDPGDLDNVIGSCSDREMRDSVEIDSKTSLLMSWNLEELSEREQNRFYLLDQSRKV